MQPWLLWWFFLYLFLLLFLAGILACRVHMACRPHMTLCAAVDRHTLRVAIEEAQKLEHRLNTRVDALLDEDEDNRHNTLARQDFTAKVNRHDI